MKKTKLLAFFIIVFCLFSELSPAWAANPLTKLGRGITNIVFFWMEIPVNTQKAANRHGVASGFFEGIFTGLYYGTGRILTGAYDVVTFLIPLPSGYGALMKPDYVFELADKV